MNDVTGSNGDSTPSRVEDAASRTIEEASTQATGLRDAAKEHAGAVATEAREQARTVVHDARKELQDQAEQQARRAGEGLQTASGQLRSMADGAEPGIVTDLTRQLAGTLERVSDRIGEGGLKAVGDDLRGFARRQPGLFLLGAGVVGFLTARAVRASGSTSTGSEPAVGAAGAIPSSAPATAPNTESFASAPSPSRPLGEVATPEPAPVR